MSIYRGKLLVDSSDGQFEFHDVDTVYTLSTPNITLPELGKTIEALIIQGNLIDWQYDFTDLKEHEVRRIRIAVGCVFDACTRLNHEIAERYAHQLENEARRIGGDRWDVAAYGAAYHDSANGYFSTNWGDLMQAIRTRYPDVSFTHTTCISHGGSGCGKADIGGTLSYSKRACVPNKTHYHETIGHSLMAIEHSGVGTQQYGESDTIMSVGVHGPNSDYNTPHLYQANMIEENNVLELTPGESAETWLVKGSINPLALKLGENKAVLCYVADTGMTRRIMVSFYNGTVRVHAPGYNMATHWLRTRLLWTFRASNLESTFAGVYIKVVHLNSSGAKVIVRNQTSRQAVTAQQPQWSTADNLNPTIGDWVLGQWDYHKWSAQGVHVCLNDKNQLIIHWLTWNRRERNKHEWYWAVCDLDENSKNATGLIMTADRYGRVSSVGQVNIFWYNHDRGMMRGEFNHGERFAVPLEHIFTSTPHELAGYYSIGNGEGLTLSLNDEHTEVHALSYWLLSEFNNKIWYMLTGKLSNMTIYRVTGGQGLIRSSIDIEPVGIADIYVDELDENKLKFKYIFNDGITDIREMNKLV